MVKLRTNLAIATIFVGAFASSACLGRVNSTDHARTLPFHADEETFDSWPPASVKAPAPVRVAADLRIGDFAGYYPLPAGLYVKAPAYNEAGAWAPIHIEPAPELALATWLGRTIQGGGGRALTVDGVVTAFEWHFHDGLRAGGRIASALSVRDANGQVVYSGEKVTAVRVPFVDALFRNHVSDWLGDEAFLRAIGGGAR